VQAPESNLSPEERKQAAAERLKMLLEEKKRRAAQTPSWQKIEHHDHPAPRSDNETGAPQNGAATPTGNVRTRGDRGAS
jgi:hypothetical protein